MVDERTRELRSNLILEEAREFQAASDELDLVEIADAIADLLYVVYGAAVTYGLDAQVLFDEVHRSNMTKIWPDGTIHRRESDGKILKPPSYSPADIKGTLAALSGSMEPQEAGSAKL